MTEKHGFRKGSVNAERVIVGVVAIARIAAISTIRDQREHDGGRNVDDPARPSGLRRLASGGATQNWSSAEHHATMIAGVGDA